MRLLKQKQKLLMLTRLTLKSKSTSRMYSPWIGSGQALLSEARRLPGFSNPCTSFIWRQTTVEPWSQDCGANMFAKVAIVRLLLPVSLMTSTL